MHLVLGLLFVLIGCLLKSADQLIMFKRESDKKKSLAPNGYAMEYEIAYNARKELQDLQQGWQKEMMDSGMEWREAVLGSFEKLDQEIYSRLNRYPEVKREFEKRAIRGANLYYNYCTVYARLKTQEAGRNPQLTGGIDPKPLPTGTLWAIYKGSAPVADTTIPAQISQYQLDSYRRQDAASEQELRRVQGGY